MLSRRTFLQQLVVLAGAGAGAGVAVERFTKPDRGPVLCGHDGQFWHTHETIDHFQGTWDIDWCKATDCHHTVVQHGKTSDGALMRWFRRGFVSPEEFRRRKSTGDPDPSESFSPLRPLHRRRRFA